MPRVNNMLAEMLIPKLEQRFSGRGLRSDVSGRPCAVFPSVHPDVGDIAIYDDGHELTLEAGEFTHSHFANYDSSLSPHAKAVDIVDAVMDFLDDLFADRVVLWGGHERSGGWYRGDASEFCPPDEQLYVWSGPLERSTS